MLRPHNLQNIILGPEITSMIVLRFIIHKCVMSILPNSIIPGINLMGNIYLLINRSPSLITVTLTRELTLSLFSQEKDIL